MTTKEDYEEIGKTKDGEAVYRSKENGSICTEKDGRFVLSTHQEIEEVGMAVIEDSFRNTQIWIPTDERLDGKKMFRNSRGGHLAVRTGKNRMEAVLEAEEIIK